MSKRLKALIAKELSKEFDGLDKCVIMGLAGIPAVSADRIRAGLKSRDMRLQVVKNTLASVALKEAGLSGVEEYLDGPSALMTGGSDIVELVKAATDLAKEEQGFEVRGGYGEGKVLSPGEVATLSKIPGRQELLGSLAYALSAKMSGFAGVLGAVQRNFVYALNGLKEKGAAGA